MSDTVVRSPRQKIAFWKPYQTNKGASLIFEYDADRNMLFASMMPQIDEKKFDSKNKLNVKLNIIDVAELLLPLRSAKLGAGNLKDGKWSGLYHQTEKFSSSVSLVAKDDAFSTFAFSIGRKGKESGAQVTRIGLNLTQAEALVLAEYLRSVMTQMFRDSFEPESQN